MEKIQREWVVKEKTWSLERALFHRGIQTPEEQEQFLHPDYERDSNDPFLFQDMGKAVELLKTAIDANEKIIVFGDYDADGTSGAVMFYDLFSLIDYKNYAVYIPDRFREGYGLQQSHIEEFLRGGAKLIITIDCGITNFEEIKYAEAHGAHVIVLDHHLIPPAWPPASVIIDPKRDSDPYPYRFLSGAALAWKVVAAFLSRVAPHKAGHEKWMLDAVAIAAIADMVPLTQENRTLVHYGLKVIAKTKRLGLRMLSKINNLRDPVTSEDVGFVIAPRINAASRMDHATVSFNLLTTSSEEEAKRLAMHLEEKNRERKELVEKIVTEIIAQLNAQRLPIGQAGLPAGGHGSTFNALIMGDKSWLPGVLGIAATRIMERYRVPVFLWGGAPHEAKGSCRSPGTVNVVDLMRKADEEGGPFDDAQGKKFFSDFGGHPQAGGFSLPFERLPQLAPRLERAFELVEKRDVPPELFLEAPLTPEEVREELFNEIAQMEPFGVENPKPRFLFKSVEVRDVRELGNGGKGYFKITIPRLSGAPLEAVSFNGIGHEWLGNLRAGDVIDLAASLEHNTWNGTTTLRLRIEDIRIS